MMAKPFIDVNAGIVEPIYSVDESRVKQPTPVIGITYLQADDKKYGINALLKKEKAKNGLTIKTLQDFLVKVRHYKTIDELISNHISHIKGKNVDDKSVAMMRKIQRDYNVETTSMIHIHCHLHGKGEFVLHGFVIRNCFEIVWFDPSHELHK